MLDQVGQRITDPGDHHRPALDAAQAVDALFQRRQLGQLVDVQRQRLLDFAVDLHGPGTGAQGAGVLGRIGLVGAELVEVVVVGRVLERGQRLGGGEGGVAGGGQLLGRRGLGKGVAVQHFPHRGAGHGGGCGARQEGAPPLVHGLRCDLGWERQVDAVWIAFNQHDSSGLDFERFRARQIDLTPSIASWQDA
jgi:hypothetical protein